MDSGEIIKKLTNIGKQAYEYIENGDFPKLDYPTSSKENIIYEPEKGYHLGDIRSVINAGDMSQTRLWAHIMYTANQAKQLVLQTRVVSLREFFYIAMAWPAPLAIPKKIGKVSGQTYTNSLIETLEKISGVPREDMGFRAKQRAALYGPITLNIEGSKIMATKAGKEGIAIPGSLTGTKIVEIGAPVVFAIEADASFTRLVDAIKEKRLNAVALYLGGYAPRSVIGLLKMISQKSDAKLFAIVDLDAHGLEIYTTAAKYSISSAHLPDHNVPNLKYFGVSSKDATEHFKNKPQVFEEAKPTDVTKAKRALKELEEKKDLRWADPEVRETLEFIANEKKAVEVQAFAVHGLDYFVDKYIKPKLKGLDIGG